MNYGQNDSAFSNTTCTWWWWWWQCLGCFDFWMPPMVMVIMMFWMLPVHYQLEVRVQTSLWIPEKHHRVIIWYFFHFSFWWEIHFHQKYDFFLFTFPKVRYKKCPQWRGRCPVRLIQMPEDTKDIIVRIKIYIIYYKVLWLIFGNLKEPVVG